MSKFRTAMGKTIDMSTLASKNEKTRAVGNMKVNARGDTIDGMGKVIQPVTAKVNNSYAKTVGNRSSQQVRTPRPKEVAKPDIDLSQLTEAELELEASFEDDAEVEAIKAAELQSLKTKGKK